MGRFRKFTMWVLGLLVLVCLILYPIKQGGVTWRPWSLPLSGKVIVIDPGHGGVDGGAKGSDQTNEKEIALVVSKMLRDYLQQSGALVYLTREEDIDLADEDTEGLSRRKSEDIRNRLEFIHEKQADFFVTIHLNATPSTRWSGAQTFYYPEFDASKHLSEMVQSEIIRNLENTTRSALAINGIYLLKYAEVPGTLVEIGFLSNERERDELKTEAYQQKVAGSIYEGILRYVTEDIDNSDE